MRIVIDLQGAQGASRVRGIGRYALSLAQAMARLRGEHEIVIALNASLPETIEPIRAAFDDLISQDNIRVWQMPSPATGAQGSDRWRRRAAEVLRETFLASLMPDIVHVTSIFEGFVDNAVHSIGYTDRKLRTAVTVYDLIPLLHSTKYLKPDAAYERFYYAQLEHLKRADLFLAISESSQNEAIECLKISANQCANISAAADPQFKPGSVSPDLAAELRAKFGITRQTVLYSGATDERKNHLRLIQAFAALPKDIQKAHQLVIAGGIPDENRQKFEQCARLFGLSKDEVVITGYTTDDELIHMYRSCALFVFPSWHEGFGLPALEAMSCGAPTIGANNSSVPEVIGNKDALFDPFDATSISKKMVEVLSNERLRSALVAHSLGQSAKFSWDICGAKALSAIVASLATRQPSGAEAVAFCSGWGGEDVDATIISLLGKINDTDVNESDDRRDSDIIATARAISSNHPELGRPKFFIDVSELVKHDAKSGIQRVVRSILIELLTEAPAGFDVRPVYANDSTGNYHYADQLASRIMGEPISKTVDEPVNWAFGDVFLGLDLQPGVVIAHAGLYESIRTLGVKIFFVVYDLLPILIPHAFPAEAAEIHERWLTVLARSDGLVAISRTVADEIKEWLSVSGPARLRPLQIGWFHLGADVARSVPSKGMPDNASEVLNAMHSRPSFLMVGTLEPRKGQLQTLIAFDMLWKQRVDVSLVIVGKYGWNVGLLVELLRSHPELNKRLFWLEAISDEYLEKVYQSTVCLIAASEGEGFGLPIVEAAQHGLPIIARDIPVFREVAGDNASYFENTTDPQAIAQTVKGWIDLRAKGFWHRSKVIKSLTWKQSAAELMSVVLGGNWYQKWAPDDVYRFWGTNSCFHSKVGKRIGHSMVTTGMSGWLMHGPYMKLARGNYRVVVLGSLGVVGAAGAHMDVVCDLASVTVGACSIALGQNNKELASVTVSLENDTSNFEIRVWVNEDSNVSVTMVTIEKITFLAKK